MSEKTKKYADEDEIERILEKVHDVAWNSLILDENTIKALARDIRWVLDVWDKEYLNNDLLTTIIEKNYLKNLQSNSECAKVCKELDLVICFFQHYIYAFEEFMTREFRDSVIRCGLICERLVKRLAIADGHPEIPLLPKFEDRAGRLTNFLSNQVKDIHFLTDRLKYVYSQRSHKGAHDTGAAGILIAKSCISQMPIAYMEYLEALEQIGFRVCTKDELIELVNSTVRVGTTMMVTRQGEPMKPETVLVSMYSQSYFAELKALSEIKEAFRKQGHNPPHTSLRRALDSLVKKKMLTKKARGSYIQRTPPDDFFNNEIAD